MLYTEVRCGMSEMGGEQMLTVGCSIDVFLLELFQEFFSEGRHLKLLVRKKTVIVIEATTNLEVEGLDNIITKRFDQLANLLAIVSFLAC